MDDETPLELELHGYVDGTLDEESMVRLEKYLRKHPETAAKVRAYLQQKNDLIGFARTVEHTTPVARIQKLERQLTRRLRRRTIFRWRSVAVVATLFAAGWAGHAIYVPLAKGPAYADEVLQAHVLSAMVPEEIMSISPERLPRLFQSIGEIQRLPDLRSIGFRPVGAQLLPSDAGLVLHVPYRNVDGTILSYFLLHADHDAELPQHIFQKKGMTLVYWQHDRSHYALAAPMNDEQLRRIAEIVDAAPDIS